MQTNIRNHLELCDLIKAFLLTIENMLLNEQGVLNVCSDIEWHVLVEQRKRLKDQASYLLQQVEQDFCEVLYG